MELDINFQEAMKAVESASLEDNLAKMTNKDDLKRVKDIILLTIQSEPTRPLLTSPKSSKRQRVMNSLRPQLWQQRQHSTKPKRLGMRCRNERTCLACRFSNSMEISSLMRLANPWRRL